MTTRLTLFTATLVQDSALSVSGLDRDNSADRPFTWVDDTPVLVGRGIKGALVAMARRFFDPLPRSVSEEPERRTALRRSAWEIANARPHDPVAPCLRTGVGIRHKTGAGADGVLFDREVVPGGTRWSLVFRVDWSIAGGEAGEAEGILGYVLAHHWTKGRCWLGGDVARGLGWCHIEDLRAHRLDPTAYDRWVETRRGKLPDPLPDVPVVKPTRAWCFRTREVNLPFGEYRPNPDEPAWGLDMLAIGAHGTERAIQRTGNGTWARPPWSTAHDPTPETMGTDRAILMEGGHPLLPGSSVRGALRHAFSRRHNAAGDTVQDPHEVHGKVDAQDSGGRVFGTVDRSSRLLVRDARGRDRWCAARLHMHAEDEFTASSFGSAKRDAIRVLRGTFPVRFLVEGPDAATVDPIVEEIDRLIALGALGHLPLGGHKTRSAGWARWVPDAWIVDDVTKARDWKPSPTREERPSGRQPVTRRHMGTAWSGSQDSDPETTSLRVKNGVLEIPDPTLGELAAIASKAFEKSGDALDAWWCDPTIDLARGTPPPTLGREWPKESTVRVGEVAFFSARAMWRAARTASDLRWVLLEEVPPDTPGAQAVEVVQTHAHLHGSRRFTAARTGSGPVLLREWRRGGESFGFTLVVGES